MVCFLQMLFRFVFNLPLAWTEELSRYVFIILTYCGASTAVLDNAHVRVELIDNVLSARAVCAGHISGICIPWDTGIVQYRTVNCSGGPDQGYVPGFSAFLPGLFSKQGQD